MAGFDRLLQQRIDGRNQIYIWRLSGACPTRPHGKSLRACQSSFSAFGPISRREQVKKCRNILMATIEFAWFKEKRTNSAGQHYKRFIKQDLMRDTGALA